MADTKVCPACETDVPAAAARCKECFHDFSVKQRSSWKGPLILLGAVAFMTMVGAATFLFVVTRPLERHAQVDGPSRSIVYITQYRSGPQTKRLNFDDIASLEYRINANGTHEVNALSLTGERWAIHEATPASLESEAEDYERMMGKPLITIDDTRGIGKAAK